MTDTHTPDTVLSDNHVTVFQPGGNAVRGRAVRLGAELHKALGDRYPEKIAALLGEAMMIGALVTKALKFNGRLVVQCHGTNEGAVSLLTADCTTDGHIRGYARWDEAMLKEIMLDSRNPGADALLGGGTFSMTIDQGPDVDLYQGLSAIEGASLAACAEHFFAQSEQIPTRIRLASGQIQVPGDAPSWRGGGMMIQQIAGDAGRGDTQDAWDTARALFDTLSDEELLDPNLPEDELLYRLFHEDGVRIIDRSPVVAKCRCSRERLADTLRSFDREALKADNPSDELVAACDYCGAEYVFDLNAL